MAKMTQCKSCSKEIATKAKFCPSCGAKNKKPIYKRAWFLIVMFFILVGAIGGAGDDNSIATSSGTSNSNVELSQNQKPEEKVEDKIDDNVPSEYKSALKKAKSYSSTMNMSKAGIYEQLTSEYGEKFTVEAAQYAIDNLEVDWNENALKKAESYSKTMDMSKAGVYDQLISEYGEKFTEEEAQYAIDNLN